MNGAERGIIMLCCRLGDPSAAVLSPRQYHELRRRMREIAMPPDGELTVEYLCCLGLPAVLAQRIVSLLSRDRQLDSYLQAAAGCGVHVLTRLDPYYPKILENRLRGMAPPVLFCKGDLTLLNQPCVSLVGSRRLRQPGKQFAETVGSLAAREGFALVSGGANGADRAGQDACLSSGGAVIVFTPERLSDKPLRERVLHCSDEGFELDFSASRAINRNRLIHGLGDLTFVAQCELERGGTWSGTAENLRNGYSPVYVCDDGSPGAQGLMRLGAAELKSPDSIMDLKADRF